MTDRNAESTASNNHTADENNDEAPIVDSGTGSSDDPDVTEDDSMLEKYRPDDDLGPVRVSRKLDAFHEQVDSQKERFKRFLDFLGGPTDEATKLLINYFDGKSPNTIESYGLALVEFILFVEKHPANVTRRDLIAFKRYQLEEKNNAKITVRGKLYGISAYYEEGRKAETPTAEPLWKHNPVKSIRMDDLHVDHYENARPVSLNQYLKIRDEIDPSTEKGARDESLFDGFTIQGHRNRAWSQLRVKHFFFRDGKVFYRFALKGKSGREEAMLPPPLVKQLETYLKKSGRFPGETLKETFERLPDDEGIFVSSNSNRLSLQELEGQNHNDPLHPNSVRESFLKYAEKAEGVEPDQVTVHGLRNLSAELVDRQADDVREVRDHLNHKNVTTTETYLEQLEDPENPYWEDITDLLGNGDEAA